MLFRIACLTLLLSVLAVPAQARPQTSTGLLSYYYAVSLDEAVAQVKEQTGGRILTAETVTKDGNKVHRIKVLLPDGTVKVMYINAD